jgi:hypothetical protein
VLDGWTNVFRCRASGPPHGGRLAITGGWKARCRPASRNTNHPPTSCVLLGRIYCTGTPEDYAEVHKLQDEFKLVPLSSYGAPPPGTVDPSLDMKTAVREQVNRMDAVAISRCSAS